MQLQVLSALIERRITTDADGCSIDALQPGSFIVHRGEPIRHVIIGLNGSALFVPSDHLPVVVTAPFVLDRSLQDGQGRSVIAAMATAEVEVAQLSQRAFARLLGAVPDLRRIQRSQRATLRMGPDAVQR